MKQVTKDTTSPNKKKNNLGASNMTNPILVEVTRGDTVESVHRGAIAVFDADGTSVLEISDVSVPTFPRSAVKAIQALPLIESGAADAFGFGDKELSLACASHSGEDEHIRMARDMLARRSELVALDVSDVDLEAGTAMVARSKTDQEGEGATLYLAPRTRDYLRRYLDAAGVTDGPLFRPLSRGGNVRGDRLDGRDVSRIFKRVALRAGLDPSGFSGHSCRVGMTQDLTANGADLASIMQVGAT